ncbi:hypothetical protein ACFFRR_007679 [Megaselia abdita]
MKLITLLAVFIVAVTAKVVPENKGFQLHDTLKASLKPETLDDIQKIYNVLYDLNDSEINGVFLENNEKEYDEEVTGITKEQCWEQHLQNIDIINFRSREKIEICQYNFSNSTEDVVSKAGNAKDRNNEEIKDISSQLLECQDIEEIERALQCHITLKSSLDSITNVSNGAKKDLDEYLMNIAGAKFAKDECTHKVVMKANEEINIEHTMLLQC